MDKEEFEKEYCEMSHITLEEYNKTQVTLSCNCSNNGCKGWAAVSNNPLSIKAHKDLYMK